MAVDPSKEQAHRLPQALLTEEALPLYDRTAARLLADIESGGARPGDRLPSERLLSERYNVSRVTLRAALAQLQSRGIVESSRSRGWLVKEIHPQSEPDTESPSQVPSFTDLAAAQGLVSETRVMSTGVRPSTLEEAETLRIAPGAPLFELRRMRYLERLAIAIEHNRLALAMCPDLPKVDFERESLYATLRRSSPPQIPSVADYSVEARSATAEEERMLGMTEQVPLLVATQLTFNQLRRPIELTIACYRGDRYRFRASISSGRRA